MHRAQVLRGAVGALRLDGLHDFGPHLSSYEIADALVRGGCGVVYVALVRAARSAFQGCALQFGTGRASRPIAMADGRTGPGAVSCAVLRQCPEALHVASSKCSPE